MTPGATARPEPRAGVAAGRLWVAILGVTVLALAAAVPGAWIRASHGNQTSGDEPHYLLTAISLAEDGDLDVADEIAGGRYRPFHEQTLRPQAAEDPDGRRVVPHDPLLPALLAGSWRLAGWVGAKLTLAVLAGLLAGLTLWTAVRRLGARLGPATLVTAVLTAAAPLSVYGTQVYPELPAGLVLLAGVAASLGPPRARGEVVLAGAVIALPWLAVKYVPVAAALAGAHLLRRWRAGHRRRAGLLVGVLALAGLAYAALHLVWYGGLTVYAAGEFFREHGGQLSVVGTGPDYLGRSRRLLGLLVDRDFGLVAWQPAWLLVPGAVAWLARRRPSGWGVIAAPALAGWLTATFVALTMHGWWFPGRQVVVVLPLAALAVAAWASAHRFVTALAAVLGTGGLVTTAWLLADGLAGRVTLVVDFARTASPVLQGLRPALPDHLGMPSGTWALHGLWLAVITAVALAGWYTAGSGADRATPPVEGTVARARD